MPTNRYNNKSSRKDIRFPHLIIEQIQLALKKEKPTNQKASFSVWVIDACE